MEIAQLKWPGTWIKKLNNDLETQEAQKLFMLLSNSLDEAAVCLHEFNLSQEAVLTSLKDFLESRIEHFRNVASGTKSNLAPDAMGQSLPRSYQLRKNFIYAKSFLYGFDMIVKSIEKLGKIPGEHTSKVKAALDSLNVAVPDIKDLKDSAHHQEDRIRGRKKNEAMIALQPIVEGAIYAPNGGALAVSNLEGASYKDTLADGRYVGIDIDSVSLNAARIAVQECIDAFQWDGPSYTSPS